MSTSNTNFRKLHDSEKLLILPNAWDVGSALLFEKLGASAIATTSAGVAWTLGYSDGDKLDPKKLAELAAAIVRSIAIPLSVDVEGGYSLDAIRAVENIKPILDAGVAGINIEDGANSFDLLLAKVAKIRSAAEALGTDVFINVRTDVYLQSLVPAEEQIKETIRRGKAAKEAGADGFFIPSLANEEAIKAIVEGIDLPINLMAWPDLPDATELNKLGVKRLSAGSAISQIVWKNATDIATDFLNTGNSGPLMKDNLDYSFMQSLAKLH